MTYFSSIRYIKDAVTIAFGMVTQEDCLKYIQHSVIISVYIKVATCNTQLLNIYVYT